MQKHDLQFNVYMTVSEMPSAKNIRFWSGSLFSKKYKVRGLITS